MQHPTEITQLKQGLLPKKIRQFMEMESAGGLVMIAVTILTLLLANSFLYDAYERLIHYPILIGLPSWGATLSLAHWVQDALMVLFFLLIGMELKREMVEGFLSKKEQIILPLIAAAGGMLVPSMIFYSLHHDLPLSVHGWAIPSATDIAFALAVLMLCSKNFPPAAKIFLLAIAIFDDLGAILIIAAFYSHATFNIAALLGCVGGLGTLLLCNRLHISRFIPYALAGITLALSFHALGIHTTLAGVITGLCFPLRSKDGKRATLITITHHLHPYVSFLILPLFAFVSAGVDLRGLDLQTLLTPVPLAIILGLFVGKQIGIFGSTWLLIRTKLIAMPEGTRMIHLYAVSVVAGIGFTMSLFIGFLAYKEPLLHDLVKLGVLAGSCLSTLWGALILRLCPPPLSHHPVR